MKDRPGLLGLLWIYAAVNFSLAFINVLFFPLVLAFASEASAGGVLSAAGIGQWREASRSAPGEAPSGGCEA